MAARSAVHLGTGLWVALLASAIAGGSFAGCASKNTGGFPVDDGGGSDDDATSSGTGSSGSGNSSGSGSSSSGKSSSSGGSSGSKSSSSGSGSGSSSRDSGSSSGDQKVPSNVQFNDAGIPLCGTSPCPLTSNQCCVDVLGNGSCPSQGASCASDAIFRCVQRTDCPANQVCCGVANQSAATAGSECQDVASTGNHCTPVATSASSTEGSAQICQTDAECITGSCIWQDCSVGTLKPSLTMCGIQSAAPFNCVAHQ